MSSSIQQLLIGSNAGASGGGAEATAFLARTSGLDSTHINAYIALIDGLVADGVWSKLDMLHVYATQDSTTSLLNLVSTSFNGTNSGATFTADLGWQGTQDGSNHILTGFNPSTATSPQYTQDSAHMSIWGVADAGFSFNAFIGGNTDAAHESNIFPWLRSDDKMYFRVNSGNTSGVSKLITGTAGHWIANRSSSSQVTGYSNATSVYSNGSDTSVPAINVAFDTLAVNDNATHRGNGAQAAMASFGSSLSSTDVTNFYGRLRTYMTTVGVP